MDQQKLLDPFALWKTIYEKSEENLSGGIQETLKSEAFSEWLGQVQNGYLQYQQLVQQTTDAYLKQINMPTREEISSIAELVINVEEKIESLEEKVEDELLDNPLEAEVSKLKSGISKLDKKMDQILKMLKEESERTPASAEKPANQPAK